MALAAAGLAEAPAALERVVPGLQAPASRTNGKQQGQAAHATRRAAAALAGKETS